MKLQNKALIDFKGQPLREAPPQGVAPTGDETIITLAAILVTLVARNPTQKPYSEDENRLRWNVARQLANVPEFVPFEFPEKLVAAVKSDVAIQYGPMIAGQVLEELAGPSPEVAEGPKGAAPDGDVIA